MRKVILLALLVAVSALATTGVAFADHDPPDGPADDPSFIGGNPPCAGALKIDPVAGGTYNLNFGAFAGTITITVNNTADGPTFDFITDHPLHLITSVVVKGGPNANFYDYSGQPSGGLAHDDGLHSPLNLNNDKWYGLSHICFASRKK